MINTADQRFLIEFHTDKEGWHNPFGDGYLVSGLNAHITIFPKPKEGQPDPKALDVDQTTLVSYLTAGGPSKARITRKK